MSAFALGVAMVATTLGGSRAWAQVIQPTLTLDWSGPADCPTGADVSSRVEELLGRPLGTSQATYAATGHATQHRHHVWQLALTVTSGGASRHRGLNGDSCDALADAAALILAMAIDPVAAMAHPPVPRSASPRQTPPLPAIPVPQPAVPQAPLQRVPAGVPAADPVPATGTPPSPPAVAAQAPAPPVRVVPPAVQGVVSPPAASRERHPARWTVRASVVGDLGALPLPSPGLGVLAGAEFGVLRVQLGGAAWLPQRATAAGTVSRGGDFDLETGSLGVCAVARPTALDVAVCVDVEAGRLGGRGYGVTAPASGYATWVAGSLGITGRRHLTGRWSVVLEATAVVPAARPTFVLSNVGGLYQPTAVGARGGVGMEATF